MTPGALVFGLATVIIVNVSWLCRVHRSRQRFTADCWQIQVDQRHKMVEELMAVHLQEGMSFANVLELLGASATHDDAGHEELAKLTTRYSYAKAWPLWSTTPCDYLVVHFDNANCIADKNYLLID